MFSVCVTYVWRILDSLFSYLRRISEVREAYLAYQRRMCYVRAKYVSLLRGMCDLLHVRTCIKEAYNYNKVFNAENILSASYMQVRTYKCISCVIVFPNS